MKLKKWIIILLIFCMVGAVIGYNYVYQEHRDIASEKAAYNITAQDLFDAFIKDEAQATALYLNKTIAVTGLIATIDEGITVMKPGVFFAFNKDTKLSNTLVEGSSVTIKGRCIGYDSLLEEIKFDQAIILTNN